MSTTTHTTEVTSAPTAGASTEVDTVKVVIKYPKDWNGYKGYKDGTLAEVSKESAAQFVEAGFAEHYTEKPVKEVSKESADEKKEDKKDDKKEGK